MVSNDKGGKTLKAIIFDMDGVIIDSEPIYVVANKRLFASMGFHLEPREYDGYVGTSTEFM